MTPSTQLRERNQIPELSDAEFGRLVGLVEKITSIRLSKDKREMVTLRFGKRLRQLELDDFSTYCDLVESDSEESDAFASAITTNFTNFFRESHHFDFLIEHVTTRIENRQLRIWSAGCSTGEEPYSIAMTLLDRIPDVESWDIRILATDIDKEVITAAASGMYSRTRIDTVPEITKKRWFMYGTGKNEGKVRINQEVRNLTTFKQLNLMDVWPMKGPFDLIFCRNVVIYFGPEFKKILFERMAGMQHIGTPLIIGHSENLSAVTDRYKTIGRTIYEKVS